MRRVACISPRLAVQKRDFLGSGVPYWPLELAVFVAFLRERNIEPTVLDLFGLAPDRLEDCGDHYMQGRPLEECIEQITSAELAVVFAISSMSTDEIIRIIRHLKQSCPHLPILVLENSQAVTAFSLSHARDIFLEAEADYLLCGEPYWNWDQISSYIANPSESKRPENLIAHHNRTGEVSRQFNPKPSYPIPAWDLFPIQNYWRLPYSHGPKTKTFFPILTSRGCPYPCDFCVIPATNSRRWRPRSAEEVVAEMVALKDRFGVADFQIEDLNPTIHAGRTQRICELLIESQSNIRFYIVSGTKAETIPIAQIPLLRRAGCRFISISPESGCENVMKAVGKSFDYEHGLKLIQACSQQGIYTQACFLTGHPAETPESHQKSKNYLTQLIKAGLSEVAVFIVSPLSGSQLDEAGAIRFTNRSALHSFSPKGRTDYVLVEQRRQDLISTFFRTKLVSNFDLFLQPFRSLRSPKTKMENLPRRILFVVKAILKLKLTSPEQRRSL